MHVDTRETLRRVLLLCGAGALAGALASVVCLLAFADSGYGIFARAAAVAVSIAFLAIVAILIDRVSRYKLSAARAKAGLCLNCGYDLRTSEQHCPECGAEVQPWPLQ